MFSHMAIGSSDVARSKIFYDALITALGGTEGVPDPVRNRVSYFHDQALLIVTEPINGAPATFGNGMTIGFKAGSPEVVEAWHAAGVANGGTTAENPPGERTVGSGQLYLAYLRDPDGNKLCAVHRMG